MTRRRQGPDQAAHDIESEVERMQKSRGAPPRSPLRGLGIFGMIGWSVAVPTVGGTFLGMWLDRVAPQAFSWTIALLLGGVVIGAVIAWHWVGREGGPD